MVERLGRCHPVGVSSGDDPQHHARRVAEGLACEPDHLSDRFGLPGEMTNRTAIAAFTAGSLLCGIAWSVDSLILFRAAQGVGGGLLGCILVLRRIALLGLSARVESGVANGKTVYRVRMGPYGTATELAEAKQKLGNGGLPALAIRAN